MGSKDVDNEEREAIPEGDGKDTLELYFKGRVRERGATYERQQCGCSLRSSLCVDFIIIGGDEQRRVWKYPVQAGPKLILAIARTWPRSYFFPLSPSKNFLNSSLSSVIRHFGIDLKNHLP
jgi:hypothetical protein